MDGVNGKASIQGGRLDGDGIWFGAGSLSVPLTHETGLQIDAAAGQIGGNFSFAFGGHAFWRDPDRYLAGIRGIYARTPSKKFEVYRLSLETELYLGAWTIQSNVGFQAGDIEHGAFGRVLLSWYPWDDLRLRGGGQLAEGNSSNFFLADIEYQLPFAATRGTTVFAGGAFGQDSYSELIVGVRFYFNSGKRKSLIRRHREDDPEGTGLEGMGMTGGGVNDVNGVVPVVQPPADSPL